jgi:Na+/melibiose symporter-like transporter
MTAGDRIPATTKIVYGLGQAAEGLKNTAFSLFLLFYYNQVLGLPGTLAGLALGVSLVFDAFFDPLVGSISDNFRSKLGRRHPFMYLAILPMVIGFYLLFSPPVRGDWALFTWLFVFATLTRGGMALFHVPHIALGAELSDHFEERTSIVGIRQFLATFGGLLAIGIGFGVYFKSTAEHAQGQFNVAAYSPYALTLGVLMAVAMFACAWGTRAQIPRLRQAPHSSTDGAWSVIVRMWRETLGALRNASFRWLFIGVLVVFLMVGADAALSLYMNTFFWELRSTDLIFYNAAAPIGIMVGALFTRRLNRLFDKKPAVVWGTAFWAFCQLVPVVLRFVDAFPANSTSELLWTLVVIKFLQGAGVAQALVSFNSMIADIADENELATGKRQEGIFFAAVSFANKSTVGLGNILAGTALDVIHWPRGTQIQSAADIPTHTINLLGILSGPIVAAFCVICVWCYGHYHLTRERHEQIQTALGTARRQRANAVA